MGQYILTRLLQGLFAVFVVTVIVFLLGRATGNPVDLMLRIDATEEERQDLMRSYGLDKPLPVQYMSYVGQMMRGNFGNSLATREPAGKLYFDRLPTTLRLAFGSIAFAALIALPLGLIAALKRGTWADTLVRAFATVGMATPLFVVGLVAMQIVAVQLRWLPAGGSEGVKSAILPVFTLGFVLLAGLTRLLRSSTLEVLSSDFVKMLRLKGLPEWRVILQHVLRNASVAPVTYLGQYLALLLGGTVVVEAIFAWPGVGRLAFDAIKSADYPVVQAVVTINAIIIVTLNLAVDILYVYLDPRIRLSRA